MWHGDFATAVDQQCGTATLLRRLSERQEIQFDAEPTLDGAPQVVAYALKRPTDSETIARAGALQHWLNTFPGIYLKVDGWAGQRTSTAFKAVAGKYLVGDPGLNPARRHRKPFGTTDFLSHRQIRLSS